MLSTVIGKPRTATLGLGLVLLLAGAVSGQVVINEVFTGTPDYIEIRNLGVNPVNVAGWTVASWQGTSTTLSAETAYTFPAGFVIPSQGFVVLQELGTLNAPGNLGACAVHVVTNYNWTNTRNIVVRITDGAGQGVDYFFRNNSNIPGTPFLPPGTSWSGTFSQTGDNIARNGDADTNTAADWTIAASATPCALNPGQALIPPVDLFVATAGLGDVTLAITTIPALPGREFFTLVSTVDYTPTGSGPIFGVGLDVLPQFGWPAFPGNPFRSHLGATGHFGASYGPGTVPVGLKIEAVSIVIDGGIITASPVREVQF